jgi:hypothetical protein
VFEQGQPSERITVVDLTSDEEENIIPDTSWDEDSSGDSSVTSIAVVSGRPATARSSSSATPMKKRRCVRKLPSMPMLHHLLL